MISTTILTHLATAGASDSAYNVDMCFTDVCIRPIINLLLSLFADNCIPLLIQRNVDGSNFFNRSWAEFKVGFNDTRGNYWLGNELLHQLTNQARYKLQCHAQARSNGIVYVAEYGTFIVESEATSYTLRVSDYSGNAGDSMSYHNGMMFTTYDRDNDERRNSLENCARATAGGFWYKNCYHAGMTVMTGLGGDFSWYGLPSTVGKELKSASMWMTC